MPDDKFNEPCPARCRTTGDCFGVSWFEARPTAERVSCDPASCRWIDKRQEYFEAQALK